MSLFSRQPSLSSLPRRGNVNPHNFLRRQVGLAKPRTDAMFRQRQIAQRAAQQMMAKRRLTRQLAMKRLR